MHLTPAMQAVTDNPFPASYSDKVRQVGLINTKNKLITDAPEKCVAFYKAIGGFTAKATQMPTGEYHVLEHDGAPLRVRGQLVQGLLEQVGRLGDVGIVRDGDAKIDSRPAPRCVFDRDDRTVRHAHQLAVVGAQLRKA